MNLPFYSADDVQSSVSMTDAIEAMKKAFTALSNGTAIVPTRLSLDMPDQHALHLSMPAYITGGKYIAVKLVNVHYDNPQMGFPLVNGIIVVMDAERGEPIALIEGKSVTALRTGACSGLATKLLSRKESKNAVIFGAGEQAKTQIEAISCVRELESIKVIDPLQEKVLAFCEGLDPLVQPGNLQDLENADIICTVTTQETPLFDYNQIKTGVHINAVGSHKPDTRELPSALIQNSKVYVDHLPASKIEAGNILIPISEEVYNWDNISGELGQLVDKKINGRSTESDITVFNSIGNAAQDLVISAMVHEKNLN